MIKSVKLTIADGLIGAVLANIDERARLDEGFKPELVGMTSEQFNALSESQQHDTVQDWVGDCDAIASIVQNPVVKQSWDLQRELGVHEWVSIGLGKCSTWLATTRNIDGRNRDGRRPGW